MRLIRFVAKLEEIYESVGIDLVVFEAARNAAPGMQGALVFQAEMQGVLKHWCDDRVINYRGYSPSEIKTHATGRGNSAKTDIIAAARERWDNIHDDNHADALWLLDLAQSELDPKGRT